MYKDNCERIKKKMKGVFPFDASVKSEKKNLVTMFPGGRRRVPRRNFQLLSAKHELSS